MKIAINTLPAQIGGPVSHLVNLLPELAKLDGANRYVVLVTPAKRAQFEVKAANFRTVVCPVIGRSMALRVMWELFILPFYLYFHGFDLLYCPLGGCPMLRLIPQLTSVRAFYDEAGRHQKGARSRAVFALRDLRVCYEVRTSERTATVSEWARTKTAAHYGVRKAKIEVVHHGRSKAFRPEGREKGRNVAKERFGVGGPYLLVAGDLYPHKNYELTVETFQRVRETGHGDLELIWAGTLFPGEYTDWVMEDVRRRSLEGAIKFTGRVDAETLRSLYSGCECLLFLSRVETFGHPLVEAMSCDAPVVAAGIPALREVAGDAALFCGEDDAETCTKQVRRLLEDAGFREEMVERGRKRREDFSWERVARQMVELFEGAAAGGRRRAREAGKSA